MFKRLFGRDKAPKAGNPLIFACLADRQPVEWAKVAEVLSSDLTKAPDLGSDTVAFEFRDASVMAIQMPAPVPGREVEAQIPYSRFWSPGSPTQHGSHVVVIGTAPSITANLRCVSKVLSAIATTHATVAWYCGNASHIVDPTIGTDLIESDAHIAIWVNVICSQNQRGGTDASTIGLEALGHHEFEIIGTRQDSATVFELLMDLATYVLENGPVLKHGQTFGRSADEKFGIEVGGSRLGKQGKVIRLALP